MHDIVRFARSRGILCQGRGSAANSTVCFCLGITEVDPARFDLLFERFVSPERNEPPDIDVDFEHERRDEVIQYIYARYGRERAGLAAAVTTYRTRSAIRETAKVFGLSDDIVAALNATSWGGSSGAGRRGACAQPPGSILPIPRSRSRCGWPAKSRGFPRHLTQHSGGFVITRDRLDEVAPILNAAMEDRTIIEWDKDDLDALGILKIDVLALGMLTAMSKSFALLEAALRRAADARLDPARGGLRLRHDPARRHGRRVPDREPRADVDAAAPEAGEILRPRHRGGDRAPRPDPGRHGASLSAPPPGARADVVYPSQELEAVLGKTLGVPLFQEQAMKIAIVAAGFTPAEADKLRRAMATFRRAGTIQTFQTKMVEGMAAQGLRARIRRTLLPPDRGFRRIRLSREPRGELRADRLCLVLDEVPLSRRLRRGDAQRPAARLLRARAMVRDAREHGVEVREVDVNLSDWDCTLEDSAPLPLARRGVGARAAPR